MDEDYLVKLHKQIKQEELQIRELQEYKDKLQKGINKIRNIKDEGRKSVNIFIQEELERITTKVKEARKVAEKEIERSMGKIKEINNIARALKDEGKEIDKKRICIQADIIALESNKVEIENNMVKAENYLRTAKENVKSTSKDRIKTTKETKIASESLEKVTEILVGVEDYRENVLQKLQEDRDILDEKDKVLNGGYAALGAGMKWVEKEKVKIKDQWVSLLEAKKYLNNKNG
ncbi:hypothetical protein LCGC14_0568180 [marine sediment metagenome]|uniref:Uncharacterized protein n=1 Tax=marine sediment metagenome TaxID=412755 RepID=A0A0F9U6D6_9ZZZZ